MTSHNLPMLLISNALKDICGYLHILLRILSSENQISTKHQPNLCLLTCPVKMAEGDTVVGGCFVQLASGDSAEAALTCSLDRRSDGRTAKDIHAHAHATAGRCIKSACGQQVQF